MLAAWGQPQKELDRAAEAKTLASQGQTFDRAGQPAKALASFEQALPISRELKDRRGEAFTLYGLGQVNTALERWPAALENFEASLLIRRELGDRFGQGLALNNIGNAYWRLGQTEKSLTAFKAALDIREADKDQLGVLYTLNGIANVHYSAGDYQQALDIYARALALARELKQQAMEANVVMNTGLVHWAIGDASKASEYYAQALPLYRTLKQKAGEGRVLNNMGLASPSPRQALVYFKQSEAIFAGLNSNADLAYVLQNMGDAYAADGKRNLAREYMQRSLALKRELKDRAGEGYSLQAMGELERKTGSKTEAAELLADALRIRRETADHAGEAVTRASLARLNGSLEQAREAMSMIESDRAKLKNPDLRAHFLGARSELYEFTIGLLTAAGQHRQAFETSERAKARAMLDQLSGLGVQPKMEPKDLALDGGTVLVEYYLGEERSYVWAVSKDSIVAAQLPARAKIEPAAARFYEQLGARNVTAKGETLAQRRERIAAADAQVTHESAALRAMLLAPIAVATRGKRMLIVPDGALHYLPFAILTKAELVYEPSAAVAMAVQGGAFRLDRVAVVADPASRGAFARLPFAAEEARTIQSLAPAGKVSVATGAGADRKFLTDARASVLHIAAHTVIDNRRPEQSGIVLANDSRLRMAEVYKLQLGASLVVLSSCETALGQQIRGEGLLALTRGFFYAGAPRVLATLWKVDDRASAELMKHFYTALFQSKVTPAVALQIAQQKLRSDARWAQPYYWAAFTLQGAWN